MAHAMSCASALAARVAAPRRARATSRKPSRVVRAHAHGDAASTSTAGAAAHGHGHGGSDRRPGEKKGFVEEMRFVAMKLHTREQAPKEGEKKPEPKPEQQPMQKWEPTKEKYLKFLVESKAMYEAMEEIVASGASPQYAAFVNTGLERTSGLAKDIAWFEETHSMIAPAADGPGAEYASFLKELAARSPPEFICHFYNVYFAHSAGGKMIGRKVSEMILDGKELEFYRWGGDGLDASLASVKEKLNAAAEAWSREEKDRCLEETGKSFQLSGKLLRLIA
jgi:heme oxygenase